MNNVVLFSRQTEGFYFHDQENIPSDAKEIQFSIYKELIDGESKGKIIRWDREEPYLQEYQADLTFLRKRIIARRNELLSKSDWTILPDSPLTKSQKDAWKEYRQSLRDITNQEGFPETVVFPTKPE